MPPSATRQAAAVWLKNRIYTCYYIDPIYQRSDQTPIPSSDREALRANLLPLLAKSPLRAITVQLANTVKNMVSRDFPEQWPSLVGDAKALLASSNVHDVAAGCVVVLEMLRAFR